MADVVGQIRSELASEVTLGPCLRFAGFEISFDDY